MYKKAFKTINQYNTISVDFKKSEQLGYVPNLNFSYIRTF